MDWKEKAERYASTVITTGRKDLVFYPYRQGTTTARARRMVLERIVAHHNLPMPPYFKKLNVREQIAHMQLALKAAGYTITDVQLTK